MKPPSALARLERKLSRNRMAVLTAEDVQLLDGELRRALAESFPNLPAHALGHSADIIRWSPLSSCCREARGTRGLREVSVATGIPQYRLRAIENGRLPEIRANLARRYFRFLGIEAEVARWCRADRELATRAGLLDSEPRGDATRERHTSRQGVHRGGAR